MTMGTRTFTAIRLKFQSAVTFSTGKPDTSRGQDHLYSDTIKSAIASAYVKLKGDADLKAFWEAFRVSSAFPYVLDDHGLPIPQRGFRIQVGDDRHAVKYRKRLARLRYLSLPLYERALKGEVLRLDPRQLSHDGTMAYGRVPAAAEVDPRIKRATAQRVNINAGLLTGEGSYDPEPFFLEQVFPDAASGWYFLVEWDSSEAKDQRTVFQACMRLLQDEGLGLAKSRGMGQFTFEERSLSLSVPETPTHQLTLSLYCPGPKELDAWMLEESAWSLLKRGGYIAVTDQPDAMRLRKKSVFMLAEGSVFPAAHSIMGRTVDLRPAKTDTWEPHPIYREGRPICLPFCTATT